MTTNDKHLAVEQRYLIQIDLKSGLSISNIAKRLGVDPSTINREIKRNSGKRGYRVKQAQSKANSRVLKPKSTKLTSEVSLYINKMLENKWSPEQISGRLKKEQKISISYETIYQYIWKDKKDGGNLYLHLRRFFSCITEKDLLRIQFEINNRPRKVLGYLTPREVFLRRTGIDVNAALET